MIVLFSLSLGGKFIEGRLLLGFKSSDDDGCFDKVMVKKYLDKSLTPMLDLWFPFPSAFLPQLPPRSLP